MAQGTIGDSINRYEDGRLLTGEAKYTADIAFSDEVYMAVVRSRYAHARIEAIETAEAEALDGVIGVYTAADVDAGRIPVELPLPEPDGPDSSIRIEQELAGIERPLLAADKVRYVGDPVAVVLAEDRYVSNNAADLVDVKYERLPAVTSPSEAISAEATVYDSAADNVAFSWGNGNEDETAATFQDAPHTVEVELGHQRLIANAIEPRAAVADYDASSGRLEVWRPTQGVHKHKEVLARVLEMSEPDVRVHTPEVGGSFGNKSKAYPAECLVAWCARHLGRPVSWQATRSEMYLSGAHGRGHDTHARLAFDDDATLLGLDVTSYADVGGYLCGPVAMIQTAALSGGLSGQYSIPAIHCRVVGAFTNTAPVSSYRATSRPRSMLLLERLVEKAARRLDVDPIEVRRRNFIQPEEFPYSTPVENTYDSGDYERTLDRALRSVEYERQRARQRRLREDDRYIGIGVACLVDAAGGGPEHCRVDIAPSGTLTATCGTLDTGQGHRTTFAQVLVDELGIPFEDVVIEQGDSNTLSGGTGTFGSRSAVVMDHLLDTCAEALQKQGREIAARELEVAEADLGFDDGTYRVDGAPSRSIGIQEVAALAAGEGADRGLTASAVELSPSTVPFGTHIAVVEVDAESGEVSLERYVAVDDCGTQINPAVVEGQIIGGTVQGIGQALFEGARYDDAGTLQTGSLQDYALPKAIDIPEIEHETTVTPSPRTPHGVKGIGESGPAAAPAAVLNAVVDALGPFGIEDLQLPISDESVWRAIRREST